MIVQKNGITEEHKKYNARASKKQNKWQCPPALQVGGLNLIGPYVKAVSCKFLDNDSGGGRGSNGANGGAIQLTGDCQFECHDCEISRNSADLGAGLAVVDGSAATLTGTTILDGNKAWNGAAVIWVRKGKVLQTGVPFMCLKCTHACTHSHNTHACAHTQVLYASENVIQGHTGGAVGHIFAGGTIRLENAQITKTRSTDREAKGGVFSIEKDGAIYCTNCTMNDSVVGPIGGRADQASGGIIWMNAGYAKLDRCIMTNSTSVAKCGVATVKGGKLEIIESHISQSHAGLSGGVASVEGGVMQVLNSIITTSSAVLKGSVFDSIGGQTMLRLTNVTQPSCNCTAWVSGTAVSSFNFVQTQFIGVQGTDCTLFEGDDEDKAFGNGLCAFTLSTVENVRMVKSGKKLKSEMAVRNSVFRPPLDYAVTPWLSCFEAGKEYSPNMPGQFRTLESSAVTCQRRCAKVTGCIYFTFLAEDVLEGAGSCYLQDSSATRKDKKEAMAGPVKCKACSIAGCDKRITTCTSAPSGGVTCYCRQSNMSFIGVDDGGVDNGGSCLQYSSTALFSRSTDLEMIIRKPLPSRQQKLVMQTTGQTKINLLFTAHEYMYGQLLQRTSDHQQLGMNNGLHVLMSSPPKMRPSILMEGFTSRSTTSASHSTVPLIPIITVLLMVTKQWPTSTSHLRLKSPVLLQYRIAQLPSKPRLQHFHHVKKSQQR